MNDLDRYRDRFSTQRRETFDAIRTVWNRMSPQAKEIFTSAGNFGKFAVAQPALIQFPATSYNQERVVIAYGLMQWHGAEDKGRTMRDTVLWKLQPGLRVKDLVKMEGVRL